MMSLEEAGMVMTPNVKEGLIEQEETRTLVFAGITMLAPLVGREPPQVVGSCQFFNPDCV